MKLQRNKDFNIIDLANTISLEELGKLININADRISVHFGVNALDTRPHGHKKNFKWR
jgi:hypothetical protein